MSCFSAAARCLISVVVASGLAQNSLAPAKGDDSHEQDYAIFKSVLNEVYGKQKVTSVVLFGLTVKVPPEAYEKIQVLSEKGGAFKELPAEVKNDFETRNRNRTRIDVARIKSPFQTLSISDEEADGFFQGNEGWQAFRRKYPTAQTIVRLSLPGTNRDWSRAVIYVDMTCGPNCAGGSIFVLDKESGAWRVIESSTVWLT
jgi:hypothetical protein